jgi:hypothetical protein
MGTTSGMRQEEENNTLCNYLVPIPSVLLFVRGVTDPAGRKTTRQNNAPDLPTKSLRTNSYRPVGLAGTAAVDIVPPSCGRVRPRREPTTASVSL